MITIVTGGFFGDEGKGKVISYLAQHDNPDIIARAGVGPNAGHTVYKDGIKYGLRMIPCGFVNDYSKLYIGTGVLIDPERFLYELELTKAKDRTFLDMRCGIIERKHKDLDSGTDFLKKTVGTTGSGCGPANAERANRTLKLAKDIPELREYLIDVPKKINESINSGKSVFIEASQGFGLSLFYGTYPYVTSKDTTASMALTDIGAGPTKVKNVIVIYKAYLSRVGSGDMSEMITEENIEKHGLWKDVLKRAKDVGAKGDSVNELIADYLGEVGTVTKRPRRVGNFDIKLAKYSSMINGATEIAITCIDKLFPDAFSVKDYEELPEDAKKYIEQIENELKVKVAIISTGPEIDHTIDLRE